ncbi:hypothetical protein BASA81_012656 [Batrachochytrium salamandrivorans]|nr:hypothetical protein BASA81_012656 [Batrachochytrium salamandrivorans]
MRRIGRLGRHLRQSEDGLVVQTFTPDRGQVLCVTTAGSQNFKPKINQDFFASTGSRICLCDGHGGRGEKVSSMVATAICKPEGLEVHDYDRINSVQRKLFQELGNDSLYSGCSGVWVKLEDQMVVVSNVGDSRCVVVGHNKGGNGSGEVVFETRDHKPDDPVEMARIRAKKGTVRQYKGDVPRVCGLALSRAFGDFITNGVVLPEPDVTRIESSEVALCILGTDGVFDMCSSQVVDLLLGPQSNQEEGNEKGDDKQDGLGERMLNVVRLCKDRWEEESHGLYADDITLAVWKL